ncbi:MAG: hypothetical protein PXX73_03315 [Sideroxydans sp.]|nr:hypothetical protein [Sideroxydans sp.]
MNSKQSTTELITEESSKPKMSHQLVSNNLAHPLTASDIFRYEEDVFFEHHPRCIFRGSKREVIDEFNSDDFRDTRQTFGQRVRIAIDRFFTRRR